MRVLLHACCGPCLLEPYDALAEEHDVEVAYANPNIHPRLEYERRRDVLIAYADAQNIRLRELAYDPIAWMRAVAGREDSRDERCAACFGLRLRMVAEEASRHGFDAIATTLTVSPYQDAVSIGRAGTEAAASAGVDWLDRDFRERYGIATARARELGMYRQNYCGCMLSEIEAHEERALRRTRSDANHGQRGV